MTSPVTSRAGWYCQIIGAGQRVAHPGNTSPASTDFRKPKLSASAFCFECSHSLIWGTIILDDPKTQGLLDKLVESRELIIILRQ